jgi:1-acyl-sn-glycerol-3-phosphate acyltransferase
VSPSDTDWPSSQVISLTTPSSSASTGISIFIDSRITSVSPSATSCPTWHSIFQTVPVMWASTSAIAVGHDTFPAVKEQVYKDPRPAEHFERYHRRVRSKRPSWSYDAVRLVLTPIVLLVYRARCIDSDNVPADGPAILAPNHFSFLDHFFLAVYLRRKVHFMAKSQLFKAPLWPVINYGGVFPVRRGHHDDEAFRTAHAVLDRGDVVVMYAEAGRSRSGELGEPRHGMGRLAIESGAPVVPVAIAGSQGVRKWKRLQFPKVTVQFGRPLRFERVEEPTRGQAQRASEVVFDRVKGMFGRLVREGRRSAVMASRAARRARQAAEAAGRRPARG